MVMKNDPVADGFHGVDYALGVLGHHMTTLRLAWSVEREGKEQPSNPIGAVAKLRADLDWRGPNEKKAGHICLPREMAEQLLEWIDGKQGSL
jgi:hypothetical protein